MNEFQVGQLAGALQTGYMAHAAMRELVMHPATADAVERMRAENRGPAPVPIAYVARKDGTTWSYDIGAHLGIAAGNSDYAETYARVWLGGALITLGDAVKAAGGFDRAPDLELIRHLRNGVAHGNRFDLRNNEPRRPAHFTGPDQRSQSDSVAHTVPGDHTFFEVTAALNGSDVLFDFMGPGDVLDLLMFVSWRLIRIGNGDPPADLWPQRP